jgi:hypothetical protein
MSGASILRSLLPAICAAACIAAEPAGPTPPDRRELWVPVDKVARILGKKAMLLTREQYETLLRDAGIARPPKLEAPAGMTFSNAILRAVPDGKVVAIHAEVIVNVLRDGWTELPLEFPGAAVGEVKLEGEAVLMPERMIPAQSKVQSPARHPALLVIRGRGEHHVSLELTVPVSIAAGVSSFSMSVPGVASGAFTLVLPSGATIEKAAPAVKVIAGADATSVTQALGPAERPVSFSWKGAASAAEVAVPVRGEARVSYRIDAEKIAGGFRVTLESMLGDLPEAVEISLAPGVKVLSVRADELRGWEAKDGGITATFQPGARKKAELEFHIELPSLAGKDSATVALPIPVMKGVPRIEGTLLVGAGDDVIVKGVETDLSIRRVASDGDKGERGFFNAYEFAGRTGGPRVAVDRLLPRVEADVDTLVEFRTDAIRLTRTVTLREVKGRAFSTAIALPAGEELLDVRRIEDENRESEPEWTEAGGAVRIKWSDESPKPRVFRLRSRVEPGDWAQLPPEGMTFTLGDAKISGVSKVAGYIALVSDSAFRLEAQPGETLERRDGRVTPVQGDYAWFRRDQFDLAVKIVRRPSEVLAALTGYALPLEGLLDLHASIQYQFTGGGTRAIRIRVPGEIAKEFHFDGPGIAERGLEDDVWTITFQKELTGSYALAITAQAPIARKAPDGDNAKGYSFAARVPVISPLDVVRASGLWAIEANTETEIRFDAPGMNELDSLLAPQIPNYAPRHRVIGVFGWLGPEYSLTLNGVRHAAAAMLNAVVDQLELNTVMSTSGLHRHEAVYRLRASGVEYLDVVLPRGAELLSVAIDGVAVKPVANRPGAVRLALPAKRDAEARVSAAIVYETPADAWKDRGTLALGAPSIAGEIPVLKSTWRVWVPDGFSFSDIDSNLPVPEAPADDLLLMKLGRIAAGLFGGLLPSERMSASATSQEGMAGVAHDALFEREEVEFRGGEVRMSQNRPAAKTAESAPGVDAPLAAAEKPGTAIPQSESRGDFKDPRADDQSSSQAAQKFAAAEHFAGKVGRRTAGLLPVTLDLPKTGPALMFDGLYAPQRLVMRYEDWWSRAKHLWLWFVGGGIAFYVFGGRRPWLRTLWALLVLSAVPLCVSAAWTPVSNALLGGWLAGLLLNRIGAWCVFRVRKEALA